jgi:hypothetical protein
MSVFFVCPEVIGFIAYIVVYRIYENIFYYNNYI